MVTNHEMKLIEDAAALRFYGMVNEAMEFPEQMLVGQMPLYQRGKALFAEHQRREKEMRARVAALLAAEMEKCYGYAPYTPPQWDSV